MTTSYKIIRHFFNGNRKLTVRSGLTLDEAQAHCNDPDTSSRTCTSKAAQDRTRKFGPWFDGYEQER